MILGQDFDSIVGDRTDDVSAFVNSNIILTGGTGFVGRWIVGAWLAGCSRLGGRGRLMIACRRPKTILTDFPELMGSPRVDLVASDIRDLVIEPSFRPEILIHGATAASEKLNLESPLEMIDVIVQGTRQVVDQARLTGVNKIVFLSSGAVYGHAPIGARPFTEDDHRGPNVTDPRNAYHEAKRIAELLLRVSASTGNTEIVSLRLFAFLAPFLPLTSHFAAGSFIRQAIRGEDIVISSGGGSIRSYQYGTDLVKSIISVSVRKPKHSVYNVGGSYPISILNLANTVREVLQSSSRVTVSGKDDFHNSSSYLPDVSRIKTEFGIEDTVSLADSIVRTAHWATLSPNRI